MLIRAGFISLLCSFALAAPAQGPASRVIPGRFLVLYRNGMVPAAAKVSTHAAGAVLLSAHPHLGVAVVQVPVADSAKTLALLANDQQVQAIVADRFVAASALSVRALSPAQVASQPDSLYASPQGWAVRMVGGFGDSANPGPWTYTHGAGVRIAVLDSGIDATHPDLAPNLAFNLSEINQSAATGLSSVCDDGSAQDQTGHGTWTASLAAGAFGPQTGLVAGVAPAASLLNIKVLERLPSATTSAADPTGCIAGEAGGLLSWVIQGIDDAIAQHADIIQMSLGTVVDLTTGDGAGLQVLFNQVTYAASQSGAILIASAGNDGLSFGTGAEAGRYLELPAQARNVLAIVAATNPACAENLATGAGCAAGQVTLPYYSNSGPAMNALAAPGGSYPQAATLDAPDAPSGWIAGACTAGGRFGCFGLGQSAYVQAMGTSASAALAAGAAALVRAAFPSWTAAQVVQAMRAAAIPYRGLPVAMISAIPLVAPATQHALPIPTAPVIIVTGQH
jgi:subtilisin family serine protease